MDFAWRTDLQIMQPQMWTNPSLRSLDDIEGTDLPGSGIQCGKYRNNWLRLGPLLGACFADLELLRDQMRSPLLPVSTLARELQLNSGRYYIKGDHQKPMVGSFQARGGIYQVFLYALGLAQELGLTEGNAGPLVLMTAQTRARFSSYRVVVAATGNLGLAVGLAARALGFQAEVHLPAKTQFWKIDKLRSKGAEVVSHRGNFGDAIAVAKAQSQADQRIFFVDDERSKLQFFGRSAAAAELQAQLVLDEVKVSADRPLFLYLPSGRARGPCGVAFGARQIFGDNVHCFIVEPAQAPCALTRMAASRHQLNGLNGFRSDPAGQSSPMVMPSFVAEVMETQLSGVCTVEDDDMFRWLALAKEHAQLRLDPLAAVSLGGPGMVLGTKQGRAYIESKGLENKLDKATHVMWASVGSQTPDAEYLANLCRGQALLTTGNGIGAMV